MKLKKEVIVLIISLIVLFLAISENIKNEYTLPTLKEVEEMRFVTYNQMFGMYGKEGIMNGLGHLSIHYFKSPFLTKIFSKYGPETITLVSNLDADIISINEVIGSLQKEEYIRMLKEHNFTHFCWGSAAHHKKPLDIGILLASKHKFEKINFTMPQENRMGGGGGACAVYIKEKNLTILAVHLATTDELIEKQVKKISLFVNKETSKKNKVIIIGDFNKEPIKLNDYSEFKALNLSHVNNEATCPYVEEIKLIKFEAVDNIFSTKNIKAQKHGVFIGESDHKGVWADLKI